MNPIGDACVERVTTLLLRDLHVTIGSGQDEVVLSTVARLRGLAAHEAEYVDRVVGNVQQYLHDCFIDTAWPACPRHLNHPLWHRRERWYCERDAAAIAPLGELGSHAARPDDINGPAHTEPPRLKRFALASPTILV